MFVDLNVVAQPPFSRLLLSGLIRLKPTSNNLKPFPTIFPQEEFAFYQFYQWRDIKLKGRSSEVEL